MEIIFRVGIAILQLNYDDLLRLDMEEMLRVSSVTIIIEINFVNGKVQHWFMLTKLLLRVFLLFESGFIQ